MIKVIVIHSFLHHVTAPVTAMTVNLTLNFLYVK